MPSGLFIGLCTLDLQFLIDEPLSYNKKYKALDKAIQVGGPATNAAICFSHLGGTSSLITGIGKHSLRDFMYSDILSFNVSCNDFLSDLNTEPVFASISTLKTSGERAIVSYVPEHNAYAKQECLYNTKQADIILIDGYFPEIAKEILSANPDIPVVLDGGSWKKDLSKLIRYSDVVICSSDFFPPGVKSNLEIFNFLKDNNIERAAITCGSEPIQVMEKNKMSSIPVPVVQVVDTLGAGDFFHGSFCYYYASGYSFVEALSKAAEIASLSCTSFGTRDWLKNTYTSLL